MPAAEAACHDAPRFTLRLEEGEDVVLPDWALHVPDDGPGRVVHELYADLGDTTTASGLAEDLCDLCELDWDFGGILRACAVRGFRQ